MAAWRVEFSYIAEQDVDRLDKNIRRQALVRIAWLAENFDSIKPIPLHANFKELFKLRVGEWRVAYVYATQEKLIKIKMVDHRSKIYKRLK